MRQQGRAYRLAAVAGDADIEPSRWRIPDQRAQVRRGGCCGHFADAGDDQVRLLTRADAIGMAAHTSEAVGSQQRPRLRREGDD